MCALPGFRLHVLRDPDLDAPAVPQAFTPTGFTDAEGHQQFVQKLFNIEPGRPSSIVHPADVLVPHGAGGLGHAQGPASEVLPPQRRGAIFFGLIFLGCRVYEFTHFYHQGLTIQNSVLGSTFYVLTGTHGTHVAIGILLAGDAVFLQPSPASSAAMSAASSTPRSPALYWHFVDIVCIIIFTAVYLVEYLGPSGIWGNGLPVLAK
jgi:hypothetical protein